EAPGDASVHDGRCAHDRRHLHGRLSLLFRGDRDRPQGIPQHPGLDATCRRASRLEGPLRPDAAGKGRVTRYCGCAAAFISGRVILPSLSASMRAKERLPARWCSASLSWPFLSVSSASNCRAHIVLACARSSALSLSRWRAFGSKNSSFDTLPSLLASSI